MITYDLEKRWNHFRVPRVLNPRKYAATTLRDYLQERGPGLDIPRVGSQAVPVLLYADDAVLLTLTAHGLQHMLDGFYDFMSINWNDLWDMSVAV
ncbi:hypothetical protein NDU88_004506 [Pleurodeles waltl]|uniref:Reverse transcriptase n=1 Tax=Pleurodeles waltl TaxID=8319 RepID=A0AAV7VKI0_PLEWA|nr:hypothetical protein NDU88_004506 [Pleurodeles waltl]